MLQFIDREEELQKLEEAYQKENSQLIIIYGRRRIGKTELVKQFCKDKKSFYYLAKQQNLELERKRLRKEFSQQFNTYIEEKNNLSETLQAIAKKAGKNSIIAIDEIPYWIKENKNALSELQHAWDEHIKDQKVFLILTGSSISMMENRVMGRKSPLHGRRTGQLQIKEIPFKHLTEFLPNYNTEDLMKTYGATGAIPYYLKEFNPNKTFYENIQDTFLNKLNILHEEAQMLLREELRKPNVYFNIIKTIIDGATTLNEIAQKSKVDITNISKYLKVLENLHIIKKEHPVTEPAKKKNYRYKVKDKYLQFWLTYLYPNTSLAETHPEKVLDKIKQNYSKYMGPIFEEICMKTLNEYQEKGRWWHKDKEIDIAAINEEQKELLLAECKWKDQVNAEKILKELKQKAKNVRWNNDYRKEKYTIYAKSFSQKTNKAQCLDLKDIEKQLKQ